MRVFNSNKSTSVKINQINTPYKLLSIKGGVIIQTEKAKVFLYNSQGVMLNVIDVNNQAVVNIHNKGIYFMKIQFSNSESIVEKILIR